MRARASRSTHTYVPNLLTSHDSAGGGGHKRGVEGVDVDPTRRLSDWTRFGVSSGRSRSLGFRIGEQMGDDAGVRSESEPRTLLERIAGGVTGCFGFSVRGRGTRRGLTGSCAEVEGENFEPVALTGNGRVMELLGFNGVLPFPRCEWLTLACNRGEPSSSEPSVSSEKLAIAWVAAARGGIILSTKFPSMLYIEFN